MSGLNNFLKQNAVLEENVKYVASKRFIDDKGKPIEWEMKAISTVEDDKLRRDCVKRVPVSGKRGQYNKETDYNLYLAKLAVACTVYPNLYDAELQDSYGTRTPEELIQNMLKPGEYAEYVTRIQEINGFDLTQDDLVEEVKN